MVVVGKKEDEDHDDDDVDLETELDRRLGYSRLRPRLDFLRFTHTTKRPGAIYLMRHTQPVVSLRSCEECGQKYQRVHTCNPHAASFFHHQINPVTRNWWQTVSFRPIGSVPDTRRLFLTYDIETYTHHGAFGKQLLPFLLVIHLDGDPVLLQIARDVVAEQRPPGLWRRGPDDDPEHPELAETFYVMDPAPERVGSAFRQLRADLQTRALQAFWQLKLDENPDLERIYREAPETLTYEYLSADIAEHLYGHRRRNKKKGKPRSKRARVEEIIEQQPADDEDDPGPVREKPLLAGPPAFWEIYVVGHNISGFDEIVLAANVINNRGEAPAAFRISRNFMPRQAKLLFNDICYALPNPAIRHPPTHGGDDDDVEAEQIFSDWEEGCLRAADCHDQSLRFLVRDTFQLTHTSLRRAAVAYNLDVAKGNCPYAAVNDLLRIGFYEGDDVNQFPLPRYWASQSEHDEARADFIRRQGFFARYDIYAEALRYCALDVIVTARLVQKLLAAYRDFVRHHVGLTECHFNVFQRPTISSNSHAIFKQILYRETRPKRTHFAEHLVAPSHDMYDFVRDSIRGGRCYPTVIGILREPVFVYDICGMYASALTHPLPTGYPLTPHQCQRAVDEWNARLRPHTAPSAVADDHAQISYFDDTLRHGIVVIDADAPEDPRLDPLPPFASRRGGRLAWTNENLRGEVATTLDVITLHNRGWAVRILPDSRNSLFPAMTCLARSYVTINIQAKEKADREKNATMRSIAKLLSNALYGSFATCLDNRFVVFSSDVENNVQEQLARGEITVAAVSFLGSEHMAADVTSAFTSLFYSPGQNYSPGSTVGPHDALQQQQSQQSLVHDTAIRETNCGVPVPPPLYNPEWAGPRDPPIPEFNYQPIKLLAVDPEDATLLTLQSVSPLVENRRYPTHLASFVLAWTRAFTSEWAGFIYQSDRGLEWEKRLLKTVYGDTDSLFTTALGRELMELNGKKRIKKNRLGGLVFDPENPQLTWLVECETVCPQCGADAYAPESVFLAPKLYALKELICTAEPLAHRGPGKLRAKGHATFELTYDILAECFRAHLVREDPHASFHTSRVALRRTLASLQPQSKPFTVIESQLTRTLRPWRDRTLAPVSPSRPNLLRPYSNSRPNPRILPFDAPAEAAFVKPLLSHSDSSDDDDNDDEPPPIISSDTQQLIDESLMMMANGDPTVMRQLKKKNRGYVRRGEHAAPSSAILWP